MKSFRKISILLLALIVPVSSGAAVEDSGSITGVVQDAAGHGIGGVKVTLTVSGNPQKIEETLADGQGRYRFSGVKIGAYQVSVEDNGLAGSSPEVLISAASPSATIDVKLLPKAPTSVGTTAADDRAPLKFEAAGVRGLIDPGGYSAPANAAAASGLIGGVADLNRAGNGQESESSKDWPCDLGPDLKKAVELNPRSGNANRRLAEFYLAHGQFEASRKLLAELASSREDAGIHKLLARAEEGCGLFREASEQYEIAAKAEPAEESFFGAGYEFILAGSPRDAARAFQAGLKQYPRSISLLLGAGAAEFLQGQPAEALHSFLQAVDANPRDPRPYPFLSSASAVSQVEGERVRASFKRFLDIAPDNPQAAYFYALNLSTGRVDAAIASDSGQIEALFKRAILLDPNLTDAHFQLGSLYAERGDYASALPEFEAAVRLAPDLSNAHYRLAGAYQRAGRQREAAQEMQRFEQTRVSSQSESGPAGISIDQFVSVLGKPGSQAAHQECPEGRP